MEEEMYHNEEGGVEFAADEYVPEYEEAGMDAEDELAIPAPQQAPEQVMQRPDNIRNRPGEQEDRLQSMQRKLMEGLKEADKWRTAFKEVASLVGFTTGAARDPDVQAVVEAVQRLKTQGSAMQEEIRELHRREAALQIALADRNFEAVELRRELVGAAALAEPSLLQLRQLLLDPAVNREFVRLRAELDEAQKELKRVQEELAVAHFSPDSKVGRQLVAKCRSLAEENEALGTELAEGKVQALEGQLALSRAQAEELAAQVADLVAHSAALDEEVEGLTREAFALRRKIRDYEGERGGPDFVVGRVMGPGPPDSGPHFMGPGHRGFRGLGRGGGGRGGFRGVGRGGGMGGGPMVRGPGPGPMMGPSGPGVVPPPPPPAHMLLQPGVTLQGGR